MYKYCFLWGIVAVIKNDTITTCFLELAFGCCCRYPRDGSAKNRKNAATTFAKIAPNSALLAAGGGVVILSFFYCKSMVE